jgi:hypothetical protein
MHSADMRSVLLRLPGKDLVSFYTQTGSRIPLSSNKKKVDKN